MILILRLFVFVLLLFNNNITCDRDRTFPFSNPAQSLRGRECSTHLSQEGLESKHYIAAKIKIATKHCHYNLRYIYRKEAAPTVTALSLSTSTALSSYLMFCIT